MRQEYKLEGHSRGVSMLKRKENSTALNVVARSNEIRHQILAKQWHWSVKSKIQIEVS